MTTKNNTKKIDIPLTQLISYLDLSILITAITENFDVTPKKDSEQKDIMVFVDNKILDNKNSAIKFLTK